MLSDDRLSESNYDIASWIPSVSGRTVNSVPLLAAAYEDHEDDEEA